ncbi:hypothetical protein AVEN_67025-1 [Araneus ventricosus]|uniref:Uncharacterized protein n=1 Tax=Araneus ventricosus TaxID=182803 RepID=A0A4Y2E5F9_ARAVE|nr:hypothetical protein AVEN_67025-1 [Araneus ventricosus]
MPRYDIGSDISVYLLLFERQISRIDILKENWVTHFLPLLPLEIVNIVAREPDPKANEYDYRDFPFELQNYFEEWVSGLNIETFEDLKELLVTDQLKQKLPPEVRDNFLDDLPKIKSIEELVNELDDYETTRRNVKKEINRNSHENTNKKPFVKAPEKSA